MASAADRIVAAPFAILGSIGVVAQIPNLNRLLKKNDIDFEEMTAGEFKRSVSIFGEITPAGREHFRGKLDATHDDVQGFRRARTALALDIEKVANGDTWLGREALALGLVDELATSDDYLFRARESARIYEISLQEPKSMLRRLLDGWASPLSARWTFVVERLANSGDELALAATASGIMPCETPDSRRICCCRKGPSHSHRHSRPRDAPGRRGDPRQRIFRKMPGRSRRRRPILR